MRIDLSQYDGEEVREVILQKLEEMDDRDKIVYINFPAGGECSITGDLNLPCYNERKYIFDGNNCDIEIKGAINTDQIKGLVVEDKEDPENGALFYMQRFIFKNIRFYQDSDNEAAVRIASAYHSRFENCEFRGGQTAVEAIFAMNTVFDQCEFHGQNKQGTLIRSGQGDPLSSRDKYFADATGQNSQSNNVVFRSCRWFSTRGTDYCARDYASNNIRYEGCTFEGVTPIHAIVHDDRQSTTVTSFTVSDAHIEFVGHKLVSVIDSRQSGGKVFLDRIYSQYGNAIQVDASGNAVMCIRDWVYYPGGGMATDGMQPWEFELNYNISCGSREGSSPFKPEFWHGEKLPSYIYCRDREAVSGKGYTPGMFTFTEDSIKKGEAASRVWLSPARLEVDVDALKFHKAKGRKWTIGDKAVDYAIDVITENGKRSILLV